MERDFIVPMFSSEEIENIKNLPRRDRSHPLTDFLFPQDQSSQVYSNTNSAIRLIETKNRVWLQSIKTRLLNTEDYSTPASALGEIRAYGSLLRTRLNVTSIPESDQSTPDFKVEHNGESVIIEVHSKQFDSTEARALADFNNAPQKYPARGRAIVREHSVTPFGRPRKGENVSENVISRLAQIKIDELQFTKDNPCILWLDFQDTVWNLTIRQDSACPIRTDKGELYAGEIWYAFYGYKDAPIFAGETPELRGIRHTVRMKHIGRFRNNTKIDAVVFSFPRSTIVLENIYSKKQVPAWFWELFIHADWFQYEYSKMNWPNNNLPSIIINDIYIINSFDKLLLYSW